MKLDRGDVVVVGGGIVGVTSAYFLRKRGLEVVLVEGQELAYGASGRNMGFVWLQGRNPGLALSLARTSVEIYRDLDEQLAQSFDFRPTGGLIYFYTPEQHRVLKDFVKVRQSHGIRLELLDAKATREAAPMLPESVIGATHCEEDAHINPRAFVRNLGDLCRRLGVRIHEQTPAVGLKMSDGQVTGVRTIRGDVDAGQVVWAAGIWSSLLESEGIDLPLIPKRMGALMTEPLPMMLSKVVYAPTALKEYDMIRSLPTYDDRDFTAPWEETDDEYQHMEVMAQRPDGRLLLGCPIDSPKRLDQRLPIRSLQIMLRAFIAQWPQYRDVCIEGAWAGIVPNTPDSLPILDKVNSHPGLVLATGHGYGNAAGPATGELVAQLVCGEQSSLPIEELSLSRPSLTVKNTIGRW